MNGPRAAFHESLNTAERLGDSCSDIAIVRLPFHIHRRCSSVWLLGTATTYLRPSTTVHGFRRSARRMHWFTNYHSILIVSDCGRLCLIPWWDLTHSRIYRCGVSASLDSGSVYCPHWLMYIQTYRCNLRAELRAAPTYTNTGALAIFLPVWAKNVLLSTFRL